MNEIHEIIKHEKEFYRCFINYIGNGIDYEDQIFFNYLTKEKFQEKKEKLISILQIILKVSKNHCRDQNFLIKIERIIFFYQTEIKQTFSNYEIFDIFKNNKNILLFLLEKSILTIDKHVIHSIFSKNKKYKDYKYFFQPEIKTFLDKEENSNKEKYIFNFDATVTCNFERKRQVGENDSYICSLIRDDSIDEFISYVNKINLHILHAKIENSIFETNPFLRKNDKTGLIEYAAFFGSIQIFNYLRMNKVELKPSLWLYAIHSNNFELIHLLEENHVEPEDISYKKCLEESIKCHHNEIANYIIENLFKNNIKDNNIIVSYCFRYHNFLFLPNDFDDKIVFLCSCKYNYFTLVKFLVNKKKVDLNIKIIDILNFQ